MTIHFIGAGPGAPDLITLRGRDLIAASPVCLYAGSLIPKAMLDWCPQGARIVDTAPLALDAIIAEMETRVPTLSVGDAVMQMELAGTPLLVFRNEKHGGVNVVHRRDDGNVGWIDPRNIG